MMESFIYSIVHVYVSRVKKTCTLVARSVMRRLASALYAGVSTWAMKLLDSADSICRQIVGRFLFSRNHL